MVSRVIARSKLTGLTKNGTTYHILAAAADEDAEQYFQMARLRDLFDLDKATGSDLDARAAEIVPNTISRRDPQRATGPVVFGRDTTTGTVPIPSGSIVAASDAQGQIKFETTGAGEILAGNLDSAPVTVRAIERGSRGNVAAGTITQFVSRIPGVKTVTNTSAFSNGQDRESDENFRARKKAHIQSLSRATPAALETAAVNAVLNDGRRVLFAKLQEPAIPTGSVTLYVDDGFGTIEEYSDTYVSSPQVLLGSAVGGEVEVFTGQKPVRDDGSLVVELDSGGGFTPMVRNTDFSFDSATGRIYFLMGGVTGGSLTAGDSVRAQYRYYTGLIQEVNKILYGDPLNSIVYPGMRGAGIQVLVQAPSLSSQSLTGSISVLPGYDPISVAAEVSTAIQNYINTLPIGGDVIAAELIERAMAVTGMFNFRILDLSGSSGADQIILDDQVARISASSITLV